MQNYSNTVATYMITQVAATYLPIQSQLNDNSDKHKEQEVHL